MITPPFGPQHARILSVDLHSAGAPAVSPDGRRLVFCGKAGAHAAWQLYEVLLPDGRPRQLTRLDGGAADPAHLPDGGVVFTSPVALAPATVGARPEPSLWVLEEGGGTRRLSFGVGGVADPTVLQDGRILFVGAQPAEKPGRPVRRALFTINADGTALRPYAAHHQGLPGLHRPRETQDGRIIFLASDRLDQVLEGTAEQVLASRPFMSRGPLLPALEGPCRSLEPQSDGTILAALPLPDSAAGDHAFGIYRVPPGKAPSRLLLIQQPRWSLVEAIRVERRPVPRQRPSFVRPDDTTGVLLCLDANETDGDSGDGSRPRARRVRVTARGSAEESSVLGEAPVHEDGSFLIEVPADLPVGLELLDPEGRVLRRVSPFLWVRPGEIRACPGCHAPHAHAARNIRPMAVDHPPVKFGLGSAGVANGGSAR
jgi:hypothetical protein